MRPMLDSRRQFLIGSCATALCSPTLLRAQTDGAAWPTQRPIRLVVPGAPGGLFDVWARQLIDRLSPPLGQTIVPDHRVGAGGLLATQHLARSAPDGSAAVVRLVEPRVTGFGLGRRSTAQTDLQHPILTRWSPVRPG